VHPDLVKLLAEAQCCDLLRVAGRYRLASSAKAKQRWRNSVRVMFRTPVPGRDECQVRWVPTSVELIGIDGAR
jgi:hypothetical protein